METHPLDPTDRVETELETATKCLFCGEYTDEQMNELKPNEAKDNYHIEDGYCDSGCRQLDNNKSEKITIEIYEESSVLSLYPSKKEYVSELFNCKIIKFKIINP